MTSLNVSSDIMLCMLMCVYLCTCTCTLYTVHEGAHEKFNAVYVIVVIINIYSLGFFPLSVLFCYACECIL